MTVLLLGLLVFLGVHSLRIVAPQWREAQIARRGEGPWKGLYSLASAVGLGLMVWGYALSRTAPVDLWMPPLWTRHLAVLLMWPSFVLLTAAYVPGSHIRARLQHPMLLGVKLWAAAHLLANGRLADVILFGAFLVWAVADFRSARQRPSATSERPLSAVADGVVLGVGTLAWAVFAFWGHAWLIGVAPLG